MSKTIYSRAIKAITLILLPILLGPTSQVKQSPIMYDDFDEAINFTVLIPWQTNNLSYTIVNLPNNLDEQSVRDTIKAAFNSWATHSKLVFTEVATEAEANISISFNNKDFDGPSNILARGALPPIGFLHFDKDENWSLTVDATDTTFKEIDLFTVALHEIGHNLAVMHSSVKDAVMYNFYTGPRRLLHQDDIDAVQKLYGKPDPASN